MRSILLCLTCLLLLPAFSSAQYVMEEEDHVHDFTFPKSDVYNTLRWQKKEIRSGREYDLYNQMDSGLVIIHEYVMMNCRPCITAGKGLEKIVSSMRKLYPGRIRYFQTVYEDETNAATMKKWVKENGFTPDAVFIKGAEEVKFYGGMGMPTILVLGGGKRHKGYYRRLGYSPRDNGVIIKAVRRALDLSVNKFEAAEK
ncbi:hypothetical protein [Taibaiella helva]|uniref:hypothetical protein n=1 Tax=Taibaiella helva TaxID=2301235 RepID=UPI001300B636|nr:hypothetical protein [Taibaiella helva]